MITKTFTILSYCSIPEKIRKTCVSIEEVSPDVYVAYTITSKEDQAEFDDDFTLDDWVIKKYPELVGQEILIHIDY